MEGLLGGRVGNASPVLFILLPWYLGELIESGRKECLATASRAFT